jgi:hypothetical protein
LSTEIALPRGFIISMGEYDVFRTCVSALEAVASQTLLLDYVVDTVLILGDAIGRADLCTSAALGASSHLEDLGPEELGFDGQSALLGVVLTVGTVLALGGLAPDGRTGVEHIALSARRYIRRLLSFVGGFTGCPLSARNLPNDSHPILQLCLPQLQHILREQALQFLRRERGEAESLDIPAQTFLQILELSSQQIDIFLDGLSHIV